MTLEELLNKLIEKGRVPFGENRIDKINRAEQYAGNWNWCCWGSKDAIQKRKSTRELVSIESGLWQFVCENGMRPKRVGYEEHHWQRDNHTNGRGMVMESEPEYRLIETSLKNEDELEQFLLENIKVE